MGITGAHGSLGEETQHEETGGCVWAHVCTLGHLQALVALKLVHAHPIFTARSTWVRDPAVGYDFCQEDPERPHVRFDGENSKVNGLRRGPFDGEFGTCREEAKGHSTWRYSISLCSHRHWQAVPQNQPWVLQAVDCIRGLRWDLLMVLWSYGDKARGR